MNPTLLIVDDDEEIRTQMKWALAQEYDVCLAEDRAAALATFTSARPAVVLLDLGLPPHPDSPEEGMATLAEMLTRDRLAKVIVVSGQSERTNALRAVGEGAYDFIAKPVVMDELKLILKRAFHIAQLEREYRALQQQQRDSGAFEGMLGTSPPMIGVFGTIQKVATTEVPVLILGESGTGKEMAALAIHRRSTRRDRAFIAINCSAIPETLLESELFGHEKGAFTGAHVQRQGRIETANGGTLFLDEVGELTPPLQVKLLRFLQDGRIERVGGRKSIQIDARVLCATNTDLQKAIETGKFREDLFYRIAVVTVAMPPLRSRGSDIMLLAQFFLKRFAAQSQKDPPKLAFDAHRAITDHPWPGNVRELENRIKRAVIMADGPRVTASDLELADAGEVAPVRALKEARETVERELIVRALQRSNGKIAPAANELGVARPTLYELMDKLGIRRGKGEE